MTQMVFKIWMVLCFLGVAPAYGQNLHPESLRGKVIQVQTEEGKPVRVVFGDGKVIGFRYAEFFETAATSLTLSENSCNARLGDRVEYRVPVIKRILIPVWLAHPRFAGQPVLVAEDDGFQVRSEIRILTPLNTPDFADQSAQVRALPGAPLADKQVGSRPNLSSWIECGEDCSGLLPTTDRILFWNENFETSSSQTTMVESQSSRKNQISSRLENIAFAVEGSKILFNKPENSFGYMAEFLPSGVAYQFEWFFVASNLVDPTDPLCSQRWDVDFSRIFAYFTASSQIVQNPDLIQLSSYPEYLFHENSNFARTMARSFEKSNWEDTRVIQ